MNTTTITAFDLESGMEIVVPERPDMYVIVNGDVYRKVP